MRWPRSLLLVSVVLALLAFLSVAHAGTAGSNVKIIGEEHWVTTTSAADASPLRIWVWEKRLDSVDARSYSISGKVVLLAHGATIPGRVLFDLQVPGVSDLTYSLMDYLAERGFDVFALDYQNYGRSDLHECGRCVTTQAAARDINAAVDYILRLRGVEQVHVLGHSFGVNAAGLFATQHPQKVRRLVLCAPPVSIDPADEPPTTEFSTLTAERLRAGFDPRVADASMMDAFVREATRFPRVPNGWMDRKRLDARLIHAPTMIIMGALDRLTPITQPELPGFYRDLASTDKQFIIVPSAGHGLFLHKPRLRFFMEVTKWFTLEQPGWRMELVAPSKR